MNESLTAKTGALFARAFAGVVPDWVRALFFGRPMARPLRFGEVEALTSKGRQFVAPANWAHPAAPVEPSSKRRFVDVALPQTRVLRRDVRLPPTPTRALRNAVLLDMMHKTPFRPDETYSTLSDTRTEPDGVSVVHWVARREDLEDLRTRLRQAGLIAARVRIADVSAPPLADFSAQSCPMGRVWRLINMTALVVGLGVGLWSVIKPGLELRDARLAQEAKQEQLLAEGLTLRQKIDAQSGAQTDRVAFLSRMTDRTTALVTLRTATVMLPDDVWLTDLTFDRTRVSIRGSTQGSAAQMLLDLPQNRLLLNPQLAGPVAQTRDGRDRFDIVLQTPHGVEE